LLSHFTRSVNSLDLGCHDDATHNYMDLALADCPSIDSCALDREALIAEDASGKD